MSYYHNLSTHPATIALLTHVLHTHIFSSYVGPTSCAHCHYFPSSLVCILFEVRKGGSDKVTHPINTLSNIPAHLHIKQCNTSPNTTSNLYTFSIHPVNREEEDIACSRLMMDAIAQSCGTTPVPVDYLLSSNGSNSGTTTTTTAAAATSGASEGPIASPSSPTESVEIDCIERGDVIDRMYAQKVKQAIFVKKVTMSTTTFGSRIDIYS